jgi:hypothetical protein
LIAAGAVVVEQRRRRWPVVVAVIATSALTMPAAIPILSPTMLAASPWNGLGETQRETVGWPQLVALVADAYGSIPPRQRSHAGIYANNYGEAGAIDLLGPALGLPQAWSGQNAFGYWGPPPHSVIPVVVVWEDGPPDSSFAGCRKFSRVKAPVPNEESDRAAVYICSSPIGGWRQAWAISCTCRADRVARRTCLDPIILGSAGTQIRLHAPHKPRSRDLWHANEVRPAL